MRRLVLFLLIFSSQYLFSQENTVLSEKDKKFPFNIELKDLDGKTFNTSKVLKKHKEPVVLVFWLTTCLPCRFEIEAYQKKYAEWKKNEKFRMVVVSYDFPERYEEYVKRAKAEKWEWETFHDVKKAFGSVLEGELNGLPQVFIFDKNGEIAYHKKKYYPGDEDTLFQKIVEINKK
jgi:peroxiredoxin